MFYSRKSEDLFFVSEVPSAEFFRIRARRHACSNLQSAISDFMIRR
ncbi:hypothetical protein LEP1GSC016_0807 [Leptospira borgpetersenii serovar Hardjo-bovis str. Sponselee]|uniref:Uncharacterized protein n=2 Tax=Leptospira borgpetersenii TaxID=174 RepID=M6C2A8_LEPBO|nr:hypothetical protein LEP1GSC101_2026 [Leptospira borgpetersenii str. UI 09149]EMJ84876.1 hypothetical protein LEP1GSC016_0807 [Leptospira borgpetersenii serovar Hardjo-bovis str. Sponselee]EMK12685.1 hypothetical protein LEP1GSC066_3681 [Leptospira sp. serovar Kenya str. Sh9]EMN57976.1 hypothetical protein LEP1GSC090_0672 [Leptospira borgpetersenii serovar Javanica str. MK146]EPG56261.1 hypothetical protein LEP1GSC103_1136 [Leptospira borgpetersenii serovar Javanica str. UI 09931]